MKKILMSFIALIFTLSILITANAGMMNNNRNHQNNRPPVKENHYKKQPKPNYYGQGYRYKYRDHRQYHPEHYRGHWNSWRDWESYRRHHHHLYKNGRYYRRNNCLYFEFENEDGRFVFSIGK